MTFAPCAGARKSILGALAAAMLFATTAGAQDLAQSDRASSQWRQQASAVKPSARHENGFVAVGERLYLMGGRGDRPLDMYDPKTGKWTQGAQPPFEIHHFQAVDYEGKLYVIGALTGNWPEEAPVPEVLIYDPVADRWSKGPAIPPQRRRGAAGVAVHDGIIYLAGGNRRGHMSGYVAWLDAFDPKTGRWSTLPDAPHARDHFHAAIIDGKLYAAGGRLSAHDLGKGFESTIGAVDVYDIRSKRWSTLAEVLPTQRAGAASVVIGGKLAVIGGESGAQEAAHREVEVYDPATARWTSMAPLPVGRHGTQATTLGSSVYIAAGSGNRGGGPELDDLWVVTAAKRVEERSPTDDAFSLIPEKPGVSWVDATAPNLPIAPNLHATDAVFIDVDHDGDLDVVISVEHGVNRLYRNDGGGRPTYVPDAFGTRMHDSEHVRAADFNGDGHMDVVFVAEADEFHQLYLGNGVGRSWRLRRGDLDGDGRDDVLIGGWGTQARLLLTNIKAYQASLPPVPKRAVRSR